MLATVLLSLAAWGPAQEVEPPSVPTSLDKVTVYQGQALVERVGNYEAAAPGVYRIQLGPFPMSAHLDTFHARVEEGTARLLDLEVRQAMGKAFESEERLGKEKELEALRRVRSDLEAELAGLDMEEKLVQAMIQAVENGRIPAAYADPEDPESLTRLFDLIRHRSRDLFQARTDWKRRQSQTDLQIAALEEELGQIQSSIRHLDCSLLLEFEQAGVANFRLSYLTEGASWQPTYEVHVAPDLTGVTVSLVARVRQSTGENWAQTRLLLSRTAPSLELEAPELPVRVLEVPRPGQVPETLAETDVGEGTLGDHRPGLPPHYPLNQRNTIASNGENHRLVLRQFRMQAETRRYIFPSRSRHAFVQAEIKVLGDSPLPEGPAKIFLGRDYLGETRFPLLQPGDTTTVHLGTDPHVSVEVQKVRDERDEPGALSSTVEITRVYQAWIRLQPNAPGPADLVVEEVLPVSGSGGVEVEPVEVQPMPLRDPDSVRDMREKGVLRWRMQLMPGAEQYLRWGYIYSFDEDAEPALLELPREGGG
ncbi:MAG: mucoidy inhibitor MuiA family protein [Planctomycetota bacterium]|nr:MAG: mucoidy inhibitor MuiA family protein [Planctomycetota bacterium]